MTIQGLTSKIPCISVAAKGTKNSGLQVRAKSRYAKHALKANLQVSLRTLTEPGSRSGYATSSLENWVHHRLSLTLALQCCYPVSNVDVLYPSIDWQQDETWQ